MCRLHFVRNCILLLALIICYGFSRQVLFFSNSSLQTDNQQSSHVWAVPPVVLKVVAGEFKGIISSFITLDIGARLGTKVYRNEKGEMVSVHSKPDWNDIYRLFSLSMQLDPRFLQTIMLAQGWLPWDAGMVNETNDLLQLSQLNRNWDWQPSHLMGFNTYYFLNDPGEAGKIYLEAAKTPYAPPFLAILGARLAQKGGETQAAIALMQSMLMNKKETDPGFKDIVDRLQALKGVRAIEMAVQTYTQRYRNHPRELRDLISAGVLSSLPVNPYNLDFCMNDEGTIFFDNPTCRENQN